MARLPVVLGLGVIVGLLPACSGDDDDNTGSGTGGSSNSGSGAGGSASGGSAHGGAATGGSTSDSARPATCEGLCARTIGCPGDPDPACVSQCQLLNAMCAVENWAFMSCAQARPDTDLQCDDEQQTNIKPGFCDTEYAALSTCVAEVHGG
jgi:hypothetical protein